MKFEGRSETRLKRTILRGDMFFTYLNRGIGSEQSGYRPVLVIQNDIGNRYSPTIIVASLTGKVKEKHPLPTHYALNTRNQLVIDTMVLTEQIATIDKRRLNQYIGNIGISEMRKVDKALAISIGLDRIVY